MAKYTELPDLTNYYTKQEVDDKIIEASPIKTMTLEKTCSVQIESKEDNRTRYAESWFTEYAHLNPLRMSMQYKTIVVTVNSSKPYVSFSFEAYDGVSNGQMLSFEYPNKTQTIDISNDYPDPIVLTGDGMTIFSAALEDSTTGVDRPLGGTVSVIVDLTITYIQ